MKYVITDAATAFVLKIIIYTGKYTYYQTDKDDTKENRASREGVVQGVRGII
jgi:hypothetical protein